MQKCLGYFIWIWFYLEIRNSTQNDENAIFVFNLIGWNTYHKGFYTTCWFFLPDLLHQFLTSDLLLAQNVETHVGKGHEDTIYWAHCLPSYCYKFYILGLNKDKFSGVWLKPATSVLTFPNSTNWPSPNVRGSPN